MPTERVSVLGCPVDLLTLEQAADRLADLVDTGSADAPRIAVTLNPEMVMRAQREPDFAEIVGGAALLTPDGIGLVRAIRRRGHAAERVAGVELVNQYLLRAAAKGHRVALVGGKAGVAQRAAKAFREQHPALVISAADSGDPNRKTAERVGNTKPNMVLAAYGPGKQERFLRDYLTTMRAPVGIGVGGTLDFAAGVTKRAPELVRKSGLEWAWRLALQPWRLRRQLVLPVFWWRERAEARRK